MSGVLTKFRPTAVNRYCQSRAASLSRVNETRAKRENNTIIKKGVMRWPAILGASFDHTDRPTPTAADHSNTAGSNRSRINRESCMLFLSCTIESFLAIILFLDL